MSATPGPWELRNEFGMQGLIYPVGKPRPVAFVTGYYAGAHQSEPNARLIAAAPDLLAALRPFVKFNSSESSLNIVVSTADVARARAAIAKAEGKS